MNGQATAKQAAQILLNEDKCFRVPSPKAKKNLLVAFASINKVLYGRAFDIVRIDKEIDLDDSRAVEDNVEHITLYEIKSTKKANLSKDFSGYFFGLTTAELLVAQSLGEKYKFLVVNTATKDYLELTLNELFAKAKAIYPTWSVVFR